MEHDENYYAECHAEYLLKYYREEGIPVVEPEPSFPGTVEPELVVLPGQVNNLQENLLVSAIPYVMKQMFLGIWTEEDFRGKGDTVTQMVAEFSWDDEIQNKQGQRIFSRDVVNTDEFRTAAAEKLSKLTLRFCTVHALERDTEVSAGGKIVRDNAILTATFSKDGPCDECGKYSKNGRATCLCPFDQDDIRKMDLALHRQ